MAAEAENLPKTPPSVPGLSTEGHLAPPPVSLETVTGSPLEHRPPSESWLKRRRWPAFLTSFIFHTVLLIALALWTLQNQVGSSNERTFTLQPPSTVSQEIQVLELASGAAQAAPAPVVEINSSTSKKENAATESVATLLPRPDAVNFTRPAKSGASSEAIRNQALQMPATIFQSIGVEGRSAEKRRDLAMRRGGSLKTEQAVEDGLAWLAEHQRPNGSWSLIHTDGKCDGRCRNPGSPARFDPAATGLALLAFLGAGYTHREGPYQETVRRGVYFLMQIQEDTPQGGSFLYQCDRGMYNHGIASFALCEAYQLTLDPDLKKAATKSIKFIQTAQSYNGGWGYLPKAPGDLTISGWQIMTLKSGHGAKIDFNSDMILGIDKFLDTQMSENGSTYTYRQRETNRACTAIGTLVRLMRGRLPTDPSIREAAEFLMSDGVVVRNAYLNYYTTLVLYHLGGEYWENWNPEMRQRLLRSQAQEGHEKGSWYFEDPFGKEGGRLYTTAMCTMTLEIYYRFSPLYQQIGDEFEP